MGWRDRVRAYFPKTPEIPRTPTAIEAGRFTDNIKYGVNAVTPYHVPVGGGKFPSVAIAGKRFMPPSLQPRLNIRRGATPIPSGPTVPEGTIHPKGSK